MTSNSRNYLEFFRIIGQSKRLFRTGWVREKIKNPESIADHSFRVGIMAMILSDKLDYKIDQSKLIKMTLLHDLAEAITGDIVAERYGIVDIRKREEKEKKERKEIKKIFDKVGRGEEYLEIFNEMIDGYTDEAKVFKQINKLEMALQAFEYEKEQGGDLEEFFVDTFLHLKEPVLKEIFMLMVKSRGKKIKYESI